MGLVIYVIWLGIKELRFSLVLLGTIALSFLSYIIIKENGN